MPPSFSSRVCSHYWIIVAICKHVIAQQALAGGDEGIGVDESAGSAVIVAGLEVIELGFLVVDIATVGKGVDLAQGGADRAGGNAVVVSGAVGLVVIPDEDISAFVHDARYITLDIDGVIVGNAVIGHGLGVTRRIVGQVYRVGLRGSLAVCRLCHGGHRHLAQLTAAIDTDSTCHSDQGAAARRNLRILGTLRSAGSARSFDALRLLRMTRVLRCCGENNGTAVPSPSRLRRATSPIGRGKRGGCVSIRPYEGYGALALG